MESLNKFILLFLLVLPFATPAQIQVGSTTLDSMVLANNLHKPWDLVYTANSSLWYTERIGKVSRIDLNTMQNNLVLDLQSKVKEQGEGGLLGMAILESSTNPKVFLVYNYKTPNQKYLERLVRYDYDQNKDSLVNPLILIDSIPGASNHNGSRLHIYNSQLYMTSGDAEIPSNAQNLNSLSGKVLRIELDGNLPQDNPIQNSPIYSWGHRNPQGLIDINGVLFSSEHGPSTDDEINIIQKGRNYGWPKVKGFCNTVTEKDFCNDSNVVEPLIAWTPTIAPSGICYYNHPAIPEWKGSILLATLKNQRLKSLKLNTAKDSIISATDYFTNRWGRLRDIETSPSGAVFIAVNSNPQKIIKLYNPKAASINETSHKKDFFKLYPNPAKGKFKLELAHLPRGDFQLLIYDSNGKKVLEQSLKHRQTTINAKDFKTGIYIVKIKNDKGLTKIKKIIF